MIGSLYAELTSLTGEALNLAGGGLVDSGLGLGRMADEYQRVDDAAGSDISRIGDGFQGPAWP